MNRLSILVLLLALARCSTYSKSECRDMDWYVEGKKAALEGFTPKQAKTRFIDKCQEDKGVAMDTVDFDRGFSTGLSKLCTPEGRKALESRGIKYQGTCENHEDSLNFKKTRTMELEEKNHRLEVEVSRLRAETERLATEMESLKSTCPAKP